ncbi:MAG: 16S rRNA (uracil(1498)-N(3))-methyltransferase, partial [Alcaligenaceae bacterium]
MADPRFYCPNPVFAEQELELPASVAHHVRVRRLAQGDRVVLFDGRGGEVAGTLSFTGKTASVLLGRHNPKEAELKGEITLIQALPSGDKMDWIVEKAVELGVHRIIPVAAQRSVLKLSGPRLEKRLEHWRGIITSASEQCGRNRLMQLEAPQTIEHAIAATATEQRWLCDPEAEHTLAEHLQTSRLQPIQALSLLIGPEGGWSPEEIAAAARHSVIKIKFGLRVLRTE